ncbi:hypothetical protein MPH_08904 [Macrophomina phaseolina MS6]|uniref:AA1-like domain-containing protein n=1 Tax=Macrophomina phaseolina (strain MS6) TaxID=1126212 RepID=K2SAJ0_MACPH|nr:hypothetical protein MPH_08904 [Macrophomina phaseolina MS6]
MKTAAIALLFAAAASAQSASDITYEWFPATGISCPNDGATAELISVTEDLKQFAFKARNKAPQDKSAANMASGPCGELSGVPYIAVSVLRSLRICAMVTDQEQTEAWQENGEIAGTLYFAYDQGKKTIYYCNALGAYSNNGSGYPDGCSEV